MLHYYFLFAILLIGSLGFSAAYAHTSVNVEQYEIEVGWDIEPPVIGFRNAIVYEISESPSKGVKSGIFNAFRNLEPTIRMGGITKVLDINSDPRPGHYFSKIIPTKTGSFAVDLKGDINGIPVDIEIPLEDVESTAVLDFPPRGTGGQLDIVPLKNALASVQKDVLEIKSKIGGVESISDGFNSETAYNFAVFGLSLGASGVILATIALIKREPLGIT